MVVECGRIVERRGERGGRIRGELTSQAPRTPVPRSAMSTANDLACWIGVAWSSRVGSGKFGSVTIQTERGREYVSDGLRFLMGMSWWWRWL